jgi:hypothetical protein
VDPKVVTSIVEKIEAKFGKMTVTRGKKHTFLGMDLHFKDDGTVTTKMKTYLQEAIDESKLGIVRTAATPAKKDLFEINEEAEPLNVRETEIFHNVAFVRLRSSQDGYPTRHWFPMYTRVEVHRTGPSETETPSRVFEWYPRSSFDTRCR